jgi:flagellar biosynthetic protein FliP
MAHVFWIVAIALVSTLVGAADAAPELTFPGGEIHLTEEADASLSTPLRLLLVLTILSLAPSILVVVTSFTRIVIVLAMLRHALGMPETPPNVVLVSLALFLTIFTMTPVWQEISKVAVQPYTSEKISDREFLEKATGPLHAFMAAQSREKDIALILDLAGKESPASVKDISMVHLIPAFMISELRKAFEIGFVLFLPFVLIDIIVASVLMSLGMIMVPPLAFSLPLKILLFVLIDGWGLLSSALVKSFVSI